MDKKLLIITVILLFGITLVYADDILSANQVEYKIVVNGDEKKIKNSIVTINDNTYVPLRELSEILGNSVDWIEEEKKIIINEKDADVNLIPFEENGLYGYKDFDGKIKIYPSFNCARKFSDGLASVSKYNQTNFELNNCGYIDKNGDLVIDYKYYNAYDFKSGIALVEVAESTDNYKYFYIDKNGNNVFNKEFNMAYSFSEGYAVVLKSGYAYPVSNNVELKQEWAYINLQGEYVNNDTYDNAESFRNNRAVVVKNGIRGIIDRNFNFTPLE